MSEGVSRRAMAEARFNADRAGVSKVGGRSIHQFWVLLSPHFRDVFLPPQRRSDDGGVSWTWREPAENKPLTPADFVSVRERLAEARESFEENPVNPLMTDVRSGGLSSQETIDQVTARVKAIAEGLAAKPDAALADYVCRTDNGVMVHSWGLSAPARISYPDSLESGVTGVVLVAGKGSAEHEVVIENAKGLRVARTFTDEKGGFSFSKIGPGRYRVRVISGEGKFPSKGVAVTVAQGETARVELRSGDDGEGAGTPAENEAGPVSETQSPVKKSRRGPRVAVAAGAVLLLAAAGLYFVFRYSEGKPAAAKPESAAVSRMAPERFSEKAGARETPRAAGPGAEGGLGASADGGARRAGNTPGATAGLARRDSSTPVPSGQAVRTLGSKIDLPASGGKTPVPGGGGDGSTEDDGAEPAAGDEGETAGSAGRLVNAPAAAATSQPGQTSTAAVVPAGPASKERSQRKSSGAGTNDVLAGKAAATGAGLVSTGPGLEREKKGGSSVGAGLPGETERPGQDEGQQDGISPENRAPGVVNPGGGSKAEGAGSSGDGQTPVSQGTGVVSGVSLSGRAEEGDGPAPDETAESAGEKAVPARHQGAGGETPGAASPAGAETSGQSQTGGQSDGSHESGAPASVPAPESGSEGEALARVPEEGRGKALAPKNASGSSVSGEARGETSIQAKAGARKAVAGRGLKGEASAAKTEAGMAEERAVKDVSPANQADRPVPKEPAAREAGAQKPASTKTDRADAGKNEVRPETQGQAQNEAAPLPGSERLHSVGKVELGRWSLRMERDLIVPTLPQEEGVPDPAEKLREKLVAEQKAGRPATLAKPRLWWGVSVKAISGTRHFHWEGGAVSGIEYWDVAGRAEAGWRAGGLPAAGTIFLRDEDGVVARFTFGGEGTVSVEVSAEVRASLWIAAFYADGEDPQTLGSPRYSWQVVEGTLASSAWFSDSDWRKGAGCRLEVVLNGAEPTGTSILLLDQRTGWGLGTQLK